MATAFDGIGMNQLGKESQYYSGTNPFKEAMKGLKDFAIISGIQKSGLQDYLNDLGKQDTYKGVSPADHGYNAARDQMIPPVTSTFNTSNTVPQASAPEESAPVLQDQNHIQNQADKAFQIQSFISPDLLQNRNPSLDQVQLQAAYAQPTALNLPKYGKQPSVDGGGIDPATILSIAKFFI